MARPLLDRQQREEAADRYREGQSMPQIAEAFGCHATVIHRALRQMGVPSRSFGEAQKLVTDELRPCRECGRGVHPNAVKLLCPACAKRFCQRCDQELPADWHTRLCPPCKFAHRYRNRPPRLCRVCGRMGAQGSKRDLCSVHLKLYCSQCEEHMPPGRVNHRCTGCEQARKVIYWEEPGRLCSQCGQERDGNHASRCRKCVAEEYEVTRWALLHLDRPCKKCGVTLARGRRLSYCPPCQKQRETERKRNLQALGAHRCAMCKEELAIAQDTYCKGCASMLAAWRKAWHAGNTIARQLGTVRVQRRWQQEEEKRAA